VPRHHVDRLLRRGESSSAHRGRCSRFRRGGLSGCAPPLARGSRGYAHHRRRQRAGLALEMANAWARRSVNFKEQDVVSEIKSSPTVASTWPLRPSVSRRPSRTHCDGLRPGGTLSSLGASTRVTSRSRSTRSPRASPISPSSRRCVRGQGAHASPHERRARQASDFPFRTSLPHSFPLDKIVDAYELFEHQRDRLSMKVAIRP